MKRILNTAPIGFPITKDQVKEFAFVGNTQSDTLIDELIPAAVLWAENYTGRVFVNQVWDIFFDLPEFANVMNLSTLNVNSITQVSTFDRDNTETTILAADYRLFGDQIIFNENKTFTANTLRQQQSVKITVNAGFGADSTDQPKDIQSALAQLVSYWTDNNDMTNSTETYHTIPLGLESKLSHYVKRLQYL